MKSKSPGPAIVLSLLLSAGCDIGYFGHLIAGQFETWGRLVPVDQAVGDPNLTETERARLALARDVRTFGIERIGLRADDSYTLFEPNGMEPAAFVLVAASKDSLTPFLWDFFFFGRYSTRPYFDETLARDDAQSMIDMGYDVFLGRAAGFSTLGIFADPIRQSNLTTDDTELAELILHEMTHSTVFKLEDGNFNEAMATFVGRAAAQAYFDERDGPDSPAAAAARERFADKAVIDVYVNEIHATMHRYYTESAARAEPPKQIVAARVAEFDLLRQRYVDEFEPLLIHPDRYDFNRDGIFNNAWIIAAVPYTGNLDAYQAVFDKVGGSYADLLAVLNQAAQMPDSIGFLRTFAESP
jgi:predicted aminopeptidase